jgi:predicted RNase H-like HicB family nuclease
MDQHYLAILVPEETGGWTVLFPDLPGCATHGATVQEAQWMAAEAADLHLATIRDQGMPMPPARSLEAVRADKEWADGRGLDWSKIVICIIRPESIAAARTRTRSSLPN